MPPLSTTRAACPTSIASVLGVAAPDLAAPHYQRHRPEQTLLYRIVEEHSPAFVEQLATQGASLPGYIQREFDDYLKCGRLEHGLTYRMY